MIVKRIKCGSTVVFHLLGSFINQSNIVYQPWVIDKHKVQLYILFNILCKSLSHIYFLVIHQGKATLICCHFAPLRCGAQSGVIVLKEDQEIS